MNPNLVPNILRASAVLSLAGSLLELGYRHMDVDYTSGGFTFDAALSGAVVSLGYTF